MSAAAFGGDETNAAVQSHYHQSGGLRRHAIKRPICASEVSSPEIKPGPVESEATDVEGERKKSNIRLRGIKAGRRAQGAVTPQPKQPPGQVAKGPLRNTNMASGAPFSFQFHLKGAVKRFPSATPSPLCFARK